MRIVLSIAIILIGTVSGWSQCPAAINTFPYNEGFEISNGGWVSGGTGNDWAWGTPSKPVISSAGSGTKCWVVGGLTTGPYADGAASWLQSPCFDLSSLSYPYINFKVFWEMEQRFDGASFQYSLDNGASWTNVGSFSDASNCLNTNWFNFSSITYLTQASVKEGWSGNKQSTNGSCRGGNGSSNWLTAKHTMPYLAGKSSVIFRFIFGAGTICNNYDGFAIDDIEISEAPANIAGFTYTCSSATKVNFTNTSAPCPGTISWDFDDPNSGANNISSQLSPIHDFSGPGTYRVKLSVSGPGNAPSSITKDITIIGLQTSQVSPADCQTNTGGSLSVSVTGGAGPFNYNWNTIPAQNTPIASNLGVGIYTVRVSGPNTCSNTADGSVLPDASCTDVYFPSAFTPNGNGRNDRFGPLGSLAAISNYQLQIFNRWGQRIFISKDPMKKWDGTVNGTRTDGNLFTWFAEYQLPGKEKQFRKGTLVLIR